MLNIGTNVELTMKFEIHWKATAIATAAPRMVLGNISAMSTQQIGPQENMNDAEYTIIEIAVTISMPTWPNVTATPKAPNAMPSEP